MNIFASSSKLLTYFSPEERQIPDNALYPGRNAAVMEAQNAALQDLFGKGKPWMRNDERGAVLNPPKFVTIAVTNGSTAGNITGWEAWMSGCAIIIDGALVDNRIKSAANPVVLKLPYSGTTGTKTATVYHDSIDLGIDVLEVYNDVTLDRQPLSPIASPLGQQQTPRNIEDFGFHKLSDSYIQPSVSATGKPTGYSVETWVPDATTPARLRMRFSPAPVAACFVEYQVMLCPPRVTNIAATTSLPIPFSFFESIYLPICVKKLRGCPFWRGIVGDNEVESAYQNALALLAEADPEKTSGVTFTTSF